MLEIWDWITQFIDRLIDSISNNPLIATALNFIDNLFITTSCFFIHGKVDKLIFG